MIVGPRGKFVARCIERGYTLAEVMPCVVAQDGDTWTVDETHPAYPRRPLAGESPGTEMKRLLARVGISDNGGCGCRSHAAQMDRRGCRWCERNADTIVGWLRHAATKRGLPFVEAFARVLLKQAIRNARRKSSCTTR